MTRPLQNVTLTNVRCSCPTAMTPDPFPTSLPCTAITVPQPRVILVDCHPPKPRSQFSAKDTEGIHCTSSDELCGSKSNRKKVYLKNTAPDAF